MAEQVQEIEQVEQRYTRLCKTPSDINQHLPKLREIAEQSGTVVEFGVRHGVSSVALLAGVLSGANSDPSSRLVSYDTQRQVEVDWLEARGAPRKFKFNLQSTVDATLEIPRCTFLFIDTLHNYAQLKAELKLHGGRVSRWIGFHDTVTYGDRDEQGAGPGLLLAIEEFVKSQRIYMGIEWRRRYASFENNGLTILEKERESYSSDDI